MKVVGSLVKLEKLADKVNETLHNDEEKDENEQTKPELSTRHTRHADSEVVDGEVVH
jgi:hypothetical protein